ncbi:hypothetical protein ACUY3K_02375 [Corynebacterium uberis]|uniref:hypothetical protein n=1 Tax=Corynebacterium TaxID=1716 RepID=UPI001D0A41C6|nr:MULTISPECIES: hypothetical protein [Corynebacterium]MCZ9309921.1 hypothetical protein [Corynebacterium sp. c6VSa_13]UDL75965.1 hypothetical protein LH393_00810 [Corynebacterium uberis]UDL78177.1 hypothetical protein LH394_00805 [Corynebacterium uberis]UDL80460.1 hypothetical protein LH392_01235 [Corynebacterium uberis]UDL82595.1 hypothetical protein LH395_00810 [Corynebacterium uberis]
MTQVNAAPESLPAQGGVDTRPVAPAIDAYRRPLPPQSIWLAAVLIFLITLLTRIIVLAVMAHANDASVAHQLTRWDAGHYDRIARRGYFDGPDISQRAPERTLLAFFPALPMIMRAGHAVLGLDTVTVALLFNAVMTVALIAAAMAIAVRMGAGLRGRLAAGILVSAAPMTLTYTMPYTEAAFGAIAFWAVVAMMDRRWWLAGLLTFVCGFFRLTAVDLWLVLAVVVAVTARRDWRAWVAVALSPLSIVGFLGWASARTADYGGYFGIQKEGWHSGFDLGVATVKFCWKTLTTGNEVGYLLSVGVMLLAAGSVALTIGRAPLPVWLFGAAITANVLLSDGIMHSRPRLLLPAVILLIPLAVRRVRTTGWTFYWAFMVGWVAFGAWFSAYMMVVFKWAI